ncbi:histidine--tRNA ligase [Candidatus Kaiserbacteria bacterium CG10_big_fil_rev_8_21_14_0_10_49_17]|uniref:Histidine--tRNA ligase n=1 Tax=Candidatus Kaiserbacteria bacterium CG10_big_fil_rev_8_21_14_0_10_49_17 TaxID=1974609 RepID=A0A2M6WF02_9BACT|nr:MAG: histidine--tRNA ligase [Candidatus Kaiserbacteria bacterium CG10_big_fil_rev_8_21_14_0_10_49_17]
MSEKLSTEPYKGVRDFYPEEQFVHNYIRETMAAVAESFGYSEYSASILEPSELYSSKGAANEEIVNEQTYTFTDRGKRQVTLRPEMTPTVARMLAAKRRELAFPLRWYSVPNVFRYERPQRGRLREHWQLNCDIFGVTEVTAEAEIISLASALMHAFGATSEDFEIRISDRALLESIFTELSVTGDEKATVMRLLDKRAKTENFMNALTEVLGERARELDDRLSRASSSTALESLLSTLNERGIHNVSIDTSIVRGFDYYTGIVFEVFDTASENNRSLFGGGRYDNLTSLFDTEPLPAVGFGMGDVTVRDFLETHNLLPEYSSSTDLYLCSASDDVAEYIEEVARELRSEGLNVEVNLLDKKVGEQIKLADKKKIPFVMCIGKDEAESGTFSLKHLASGEEKEVGLKEIATAIFS